MAKSTPTGIRFNERAVFAKDKLGIKTYQGLVNYFIDTFWFANQEIPKGVLVSTDGNYYKKKLSEPKIPLVIKKTITVKGVVDSISNKMPKGLSMEERIKWMEENEKK